MGRIILNNEEYTGSSGGGSVNDVTVNGSSVVNAQGVAEVTAVQDNPTFTEAQTRANIASGESFATILGKIKKFFTDLKTVAFSGSYNDLSDKPTIPVGSDYVAKTGDTMTGELKVDTGTSTDSVIAIGGSQNYGALRLKAGATGKQSTLIPAVLTANRNHILPDKTGTIALTSDIPDISTKVSKSGDTMTGALQIDDVTSSIKINRSNSSSYSGWIDFYNQNGFRGGFTVNNYKKPYFSDGTYYEELAYVSSLSSYIPKFSNSTNSAIATCRGGGSANTFKIATVTETQTNSDFPIMFELSQRSGDFVNLTMEVIAGTLIYFKVDGAGNYYINYDGNNVWTIYGRYDSGTWGVATLTRVAGLGTFERHDIVINMENVSSIPSGAVQATHGDSFANDVTVQGTLTAYNFMNLYSDVFEKQITISLPTSLTANRNVSFPNKGGTIAMTSDISSRRYKENIIPLSEDEAKKILDVEIVNYDYKENVVDEDERYDQKGAIAEDVVNIIPNAVTYADVDGEQLPDGINYTKFIPYLIKMVQMQQKEIERLKELIK